MSGQAFDLSFTYNLYLGGTTRSESGEGPIDDNDAYYYLAEDGPVTATLTINGVAISFEGAGQHSIYGDLLSFVKSQLHDQATNGSGLTVQANVFTCLLCLPVYAQIDTPFESVPGAQQTFAPSGFNFSTADVQTTGTFDITSFDLTAILPEPKTWALLLAGFGLVGMMLRGRQRRYSLR
ncbi:MAG TPA: PEPxxWA-CTERM sorting domain-containing protein [Rhodanobacter sp.]|nr:PEPxxWA-CTERM sorting domain-containing protein [Rhodanobacter sp.]